MFYRKSPKETMLDRESPPEPTPTCFEVHEKWRVECDKKDCRNWMNYEEDLNCAVVCARKYDNGLSLREVAERMNVSFPRVSQIEHAAFKKLKEGNVLKDFDS
jgi:DNA-directed RNA polymerase sigma subunit (sigma70/sigma32)|tara:strand:- start:594 stop:902 length:309 start_codon:yes stop_codon:yes gene_type:complete